MALGLASVFSWLGGQGKSFTWRPSVSPSVKWGGGCSLCKGWCREGQDRRGSQGHKDHGYHGVSCWNGCRRPLVSHPGTKTLGAPKELGPCVFQSLRSQTQPPPACGTRE